MHRMCQTLPGCGRLLWWVQKLGVGDRLSSLQWIACVPCSQQGRSLEGNSCDVECTHFLTRLALRACVRIGVGSMEADSFCVAECPLLRSSTMTMKMGLERRLRERIPEIINVIQDMGEGGPALTPESIETVR